MDVIVDDDLKRCFVSLNCLPLGCMPLSCVSLGRVSLGLVPLGLVPLGLVPLDRVPLDYMLLGCVPLEEDILLDMALLMSTDCSVDASCRR